MKKEFLKKISYVTIVMLVVLVVFSITKITDVAEAQSANYNMAGTWQNITTSQTSSTLSVSGQIYGSIVFDSNACPPQSGGNIALTFGGLMYEIYNTSGTKFLEGNAFAGITQNGTSCATQDDFMAYIHDFSVDADISSLPNGDYRIDFATGGQSNPIISGVTAGPLYHTIWFTKTTQQSCTISSFTCNSSATLSWVTANCSNRSITPNIGSVSASGSTNGSAGTTYTLTADTLQSVASCAPANAANLDARWSANNSTTYSRTLTTTELNQGYADVPFNYDNTGDTGSCVNNIKCEPLKAGSATNVQTFCEVVTICK